MTREEAKAYIILHCIPNYPKMDKTEWDTAMGMAIEALSREPSEDTISRQAAIAAADRADYTGLAIEDVKKLTEKLDVMHIIFKTLSECGIYGEEATIKVVGTLKRLGMDDLLPPCAR